MQGFVHDKQNITDIHKDLHFLDIQAKKAVGL
jgi:hypothetical protein